MCEDHPINRTPTFLTVVGLIVFALAGCGGDEGDDAATTRTTTDAPTASATKDGETESSAQESENDAEAAGQDGEDKGTEVVLDDSEFGEMLYDVDDQAIYVFELDKAEKSVCYDECAVAWPPVLTKGDPVAGKGVEASLLGTTERRDGTLQVTYAGKPLYYYAHEAPGEVRCHNVNLNGGFWWVVGADGEPLA